jgi:hypothetical protein
MQPKRQRTLDKRQGDKGHNPPMNGDIAIERKPPIERSSGVLAEEEFPRLTFAECDVSNYRGKRGPSSAC